MVFQVLLCGSVTKDIFVTLATQQHWDTVVKLFLKHCIIINIAYISHSNALRRRMLGISLMRVKEINLYLCLTKYYAMKTYGKVDV
jgi:hypothetical protein